MTVRSSNAMYYGQKDIRGRPEVFMDPGDGSGPQKLKILDKDGHRLLPDWGKKSDIGRRNMLARAILSDALGDWDWTLQIFNEFAEQVVDRLPKGKWSLPAHEVHRAVTAIEMGEKVSLRW